MIKFQNKAGKVVMELTDKDTLNVLDEQLKKSLEPEESNKEGNVHE